MPPVNAATFTDAEIEKMRLFVTEHDKSKGSNNTFDLNNPPRVPYVYQEFPRLVYHHGARKHKPVHSADEHKAALADGFQNEPFPAEAAVPELDPAEQAEVAALDKKLAEKKKTAKAR